MKTINKALLDEVIRLTRKYSKTGDTDLLDVRNQRAMELSQGAFGDTYHWLAFTDIVDATQGINSLVPNAPNATVYKVLEVLGYQVVGAEGGGQDDD